MITQNHFYYLSLIFKYNLVTLEYLCELLKAEELIRDEIHYLDSISKCLY